MQNNLYGELCGAIAWFVASDRMLVLTIRANLISFAYFDAWYNHLLDVFHA